MTPPITLKGFRDFLPTEKRQRDWVMNRIKTTFQKHGFEPLETPTLEYASLLLGKYGEEADKLIYSFQDRGERLVGLRYDQTVPTARVLAQYAHQLPTYFRRFQMQNVFRADKPQRGRFREFGQCDCDIFGSTSSLADAEILAVYYQAFADLGFKNLRMEVNDRQPLMSSLAEFAQGKLSVASIIQTIDKLDKISVDDAIAELVDKGLSTEQAHQALATIDGLTMSENLQNIVTQAQALGVPQEVLVFNPRLARGLDYYTGLIFEGKITDYTAGSVGGGGRYDRLVEQLAGMSMPAVGFGIGLDRTIEAAIELGLLPELSSTSEVMVLVVDDAATQFALETVQAFRAAGINTELYPAFDKVAKQLKVADAKHIPWVVLIGGNEAEQQKLTLKNLSERTQDTVTLAQAIKTLTTTGE